MIFITKTLNYQFSDKILSHKKLFNSVKLNLIDTSINCYIYSYLDYKLLSDLVF